MSEWRKYQKDKERTTYSFITKVDPTPEALKRKTLSGMLERKKERERIAAARRRKAVKTTAAAAALILAVTATPLRGYVVSAAGNVYHAIVNNWREDVFPVNLKKSDNGCTVEIIESRVANDFLYLTVKEYYPKELVSRDGETKLYAMPDIAYSGSIKDNKGNEITFDPANVMYLWAVSNDHSNYRKDYEGRVITQSAESADDSSDDFVVNAQYRIYLPELNTVVNSADKRYTCTVDAVSEQLGSHLNFEFPLDNTTEAISNKSYALNRTFRLDGADVTLQKLAFSPSGADLIVRIDPNADLSENAVKDLVNNFNASVYVRNDEDVKRLAASIDEDNEEAQDPYGFAWLWNDSANNHGYVYDLDEDVNADSMMWDKDRCMKLGGSYYCVVSNFADQPNSSYDMEQITRSDFTVEIEYLRWRSLSYDGMDMIANYYSLADIALTAQKTGTGRYSFADNHIKLPGGRGDLDITLRNIGETATTELDDGSYQHTLDVDADIAFRDWDGMAKDGAWEHISLVNNDGREIMNIGVKVDTGETAESGNTKPAAVQCTVTDHNKHFTLSESDLTLHVARVTESRTFEPNGWFNAAYSDENIDLLNEQKFFHIKVK